MDEYELNYLKDNNKKQKVQHQEEKKSQLQAHRKSCLQHKK